MRACVRACVRGSLRRTIADLRPTPASTPLHEYWRCCGSARLRLRGLRMRPTRLQLVLCVTGGALCALLWLVLPPVLYRLEDTLSGGERNAPTASAKLTGPGPAAGAPDEAWRAWTPFTLPTTESGERVRSAAAEAQLKDVAPAPASDRAHERVAAAPPGVTVQEAEAAAARVSPDVFAALPSSFLSEYKAPCWHTEAKQLRCLPYFFILGVFQCGVRDLYSRLVLHKDVATTANAAPHFWDEIHGFASYLSVFEPALSKVEAFPTRTVFGDGSLSTFTYTWTGSERLHADWTATFRACRETECEHKQACVDATCYARADKVPVGGGANLTLPYLLRAVLGAGNAKLMVILRDPVERLHAAFYFYHHYGNVYGRNETGFAAYAREMTGHFQRCLDQGHGEFKCVTAFESLGPTYEAVFYHADQILKSMYTVFLEGYLSAFPAKDVLVLRFEDYVAHSGSGNGLSMRTTLERVFKHLALDEPDAATWAAMLSAPVILNGGAQQAARPPMDPDTRQMLRRFYKPYNTRLAGLLGDDPRWLWDY